MDTSRSAETAATWVAGASVFSGRQDPTWPVPAEIGARLAGRWDRLPPWTGDRPVPPPLGYRGCTLTAPDGREWRAFHELVTLRTEERRDDERGFESDILGSAPPDTLPPFGA